MATMVAHDGTGQLHSLAAQAKGPRNKRKFRADSPLGNTNLATQPQVDLPSYGFPVGFSFDQHVNVRESFESSCRPQDELVADDYEDADWSDVTEAQLRELLMNNLHAIFKSAVKKIATYGYSEEEATKAVLRSPLCFGCKDIISNIVDKALEFLSGRVIDTTVEHCFENLQQLVEHILAEMVCVLREIRPFFSVGDAMWCLIICDMNASLACAMEIDGLAGLGSDESSLSSPVSQVKSELGSGSSGQKMLEFGALKPNRSDPVPPFSSGSSQPEMPFVAGIPNLPPVKFPLSINNNSVITHPNLGKEEPFPLAHNGVGRFCSTAISESHVPGDRPSSGKRCNAGGNSKKETFLQQKTTTFEKSYRAYRSKGSLKTGKFGSLGSSMDKKRRPSSDSSGSSCTNSTLKTTKSLCTDATQVDENSVISFSAGAPACSVMNGSSQLPIANTELSLALPFDSINKGIGGYTQSSNNYYGSSFDNLNRHYVAQDRKDELLNKLVSHVHDLQTQLQEWSEWAQQKVMQAARRLGKDKAELQALRHEKEEVCRLQKEKQTLEENTTKKLSEMESALSKASCQVEKANNAIRRLEVDNSHLRHGMESAKAQAAESAAGFQEVSRRELKVLKNFQSWDKQKALFKDELMNEKQELSKLQQKLDHDKDFLDKLEAKLKEEEKSKSEILNQVNLERKEREKNEASAKSKADMMKLKAENDMHRHKDDMRRLEKQIVQLRLKMDTSIAVLSGPTSGSYASCLADAMSSALTENNRHTLAHMMALEESGNEVKRERECVMCLTEEMSVIFLPCAHQVVCATCNELHERQGMKECPSCRTPILRRITVNCSRS